jgi:hypothetical protein
MLGGMVFLRWTGAAVAVVAALTVLAAPAAAEGQLEGDFAFVNGPTTNTWSISTRCNPEGLCGGTVSSSTGMVSNIKREVGGPWTVVRHDVANGWTCPDGSTGAADVVYAFDPATLAGTLSNTSKPGVCGNPDPINTQQPISLRPVGPLQELPIFSGI